MKQVSHFLISLLLFLSADPLQSQVKRVGPVGITVKDMAASVSFYQEVLGFRKISDETIMGETFENLKGLFGLHIRLVRMQLGEETIELTDFITSGGREIPVDAKANDLIFQHIAIVVSDMDKAYAHLKKFNVEHVSTAPQTLPATIPAAAGIKAFYFHDPDNHNLELIFFPPGKGQAKWHTRTQKIFLGIDHTAIGIGSTEKSLRFYQQLLGLERKGESFNRGNEQAHLNNIEGASLHITGLRTAEGPGIEFLEYLNPGPGRPYPVDTRADDLWYWQTSLEAENIDELYVQLKNEGYRMVSRGVVEINSGKGRSSKAFIVKDVDGHALYIREYQN